MPMRHIDEHDAHKNLLLKFITAVRGFGCIESWLSFYACLAQNPDPFSSMHKALRLIESMNPQWQDLSEE